MTWDGKIPFKDGKPLDYVDMWHKDVEYRENTPFEDVLTFSCFSRGRSSAKAVFKSKTLRCRVEMFLTDLHDVMPLLDKGVLTGTFLFSKHGQNFGIMRKN